MLKKIALHASRRTAVAGIFGGPSISSAPCGTAVVMAAAIMAAAITAATVTAGTVTAGTVTAGTAAGAGAAWGLYRRWWTLLWGMIFTVIPIATGTFSSITQPV